MSTILNPYLSFKGDARQAAEFYHSVFGGKLDLNTFQESGMPVGPDEGDMIMHAQLTTDNGLVMMLSDTPSHMEYKAGASISVSLSGEDEAELRGYWDKLADGATIAAPLEKAPWGDTFGMLTDKFGTNWMVNINGQVAAGTSGSDTAPADDSVTV